MERKLLYSGKAKYIYTTEDENVLIQYFTDSLTAFNGEKKETISRKGIINNYISEHLMEGIREHTGIRTHFIDRINDREQMIHKLDMYPIEVVVRNVAAGSIVKKYGIKEGTTFSFPI